MIISKSEDGLLSTSEMADLLLIGPERVRQLVKGGHIPRVKRGRFDPETVVRSYIRYLKDEERRSSKSAAASRIQDIRAEKMEHDLKVARREYLPRDDMETTVDAMAAAVINEVAGLGARVTRDPVMKTAIDTETDNALNRIADKLARLAGAALEGGEADPETGEADAA